MISEIIKQKTANTPKFLSVPYA